MKLLALSFVAVLSACGYQPVHGAAGAKHLSVVLSASKVPDAVASDEVLAGVREELARAGALASGASYPRCEVEVLRMDESAEGIAALPAEGAPLVPQARATRVGLLARAWIVESAGAERERDTGDVRTFETVATAPDARGATFRHSDALRAAGRRLGRRLASRIMGLPSPGDE